jgi:copper chaperone
MREAERVTFYVPDISCNHCKMAIENAVSGLDGVGSVVVDVASKQVDVVFDGSRVDRQRIVAAIDDEGYAVARVHAGGG